MFKIQAASWGPFNKEFSKARFSTSLLSSSSNYSSTTIDATQLSSKLEASSVSCSFGGLERSISHNSLDNDPLLNGIHATLSLPIDVSEGFLEGPLNVSHPSFEGPAYFTKLCPESPESWLSDLVTLDIASDESEEVEEAQTQTGSNTYTTAEIMPCLKGVVSAELLVLSQTRDGLDGPKDLYHGFISNQGNDDQEQQDSKEKETQCLYCLLEIPSSDKLSYTISTIPLQTDETSSSKPLAKIPSLPLFPRSLSRRPQADFFLQNPAVLQGHQNHTLVPTAVKHLLASVT